MIAALKGTVVEHFEKSVLLDVNGVVYEVFVTPATQRSLPIGQAATLFTHYHQRDEAPVLHGFLTVQERSFFQLLLTVSGVGPKGAIGIMSLTTVDELERTIATGDASLLTKVSGIGKKTAERLVVELKEKIGQGGDRSLGEQGTAVFDALVRLGYTAREARQAVQQLDRRGSVEEQVRDSLKVLGKR